MYTAKVYPVSIVSPGVTIEEEHIARETLNQWNAENGKDNDKGFQYSLIALNDEAINLE